MTANMYEFRVDGRLPEQAHEVFSDMSIEELPPGAILCGPVIDEAHLHGIIAQCRALGLTVVSAQPVER